ncbi:MAG: DUF3489 domain-containing protein [Rhodoblastus sp.]
MAKLTDTQLVVLSKAAARDDGLAVVPPRMNKGAASKVGSSLVARKLMRELKAKPGMPVWREDEDGRGISLIITRAGRDAIGLEVDVEVSTATVAPTIKQKKPPVVGNAPSQKEATGSSGSQPRDGSKQAIVISMLSAKGGATIEALIDATGWLPHTTRAALTGLRKRGFEIERSRDVGEASVYRIVGSMGA